MSEYASFRQRLDAVLRTRDVSKVRAFMLEEQQWTADAPADPAYAMWLMIAGTPTLKDLHSEARAWLVQHGHAEEASAVLSRGQRASSGRTGAKRASTMSQKSARAKKRQSGKDAPPL